MKKASEKVKRLFQNGGSKMSYVSVNWLCDKCGAKCSDLTCIMCGRKLKDYSFKIIIWKKALSILQRILLTLVNKPIKEVQISYYVISSV